MEEFEEYGLADVPVPASAVLAKDSDHFRDFCMKAGFLEQVAGSGYVEFGRTCVLCTVEGPFEKERELDDDVEDESQVKVFSDQLREDHFSTLEQVAETFVRADQLVNARVRMNVKVVCDDGGLLAAAVMAMGLALSSANIQQFDVPLAATVLFESRTATVPRLDPSLAECKAAKARGGGFMTVVALPAFSQVGHVHSEGILTPAQSLLASEVGFKAALSLFTDVADVLRSV